MKTILSVCVAALAVVWLSMLTVPGSVDAWQSRFSFGSIDEIESSSDINIGSLWEDDLVNEKPLIDTIKSITNRVLWILWLIALVMLIVGWLMMVTAVWDDRFSKWLTYVKYAAWGLVLIGVAWFIISLGFWLTREVAQWAEWSTAWTFD